MIYRKVCEECGARVSARSAGKRNCPRCGGHLKKETDHGRDQSAAQDSAEGRLPQPVQAPPEAAKPGVAEGSSA